MKTIYTIGYTGFKLDEFKKILRENNISCVVDVRSNPSSKYYPDYNSNNLKSFLNKNGIRYRHYGEEFGARQNSLKYYTNGYMDFEKFTKSQQFWEGFHKIEAGINLNYVFVLMCAEKNPYDCHRSIMISRVFYDNGYDVKHILADGNIESQNDIENQFLENYFPNRNQSSLFVSETSTKDLIKKGYILRNREIGYRLHEGDDYE